MKRERTDPPMTPAPDSVRWFESDPDPIDDDIAMATLIVRLGMVSNALASQRQAARNAATSATSGVVRTRDVMSTLVLVAPMTHEALQVVGPDFARLRVMATDGGAPPSMLEDMGKLRAGKHHASPFLERARNKVGFHWDGPAIQEAVQAYTTDQRIVWLESDVDGAPVHSFSVAALPLALFGEDVVAGQSADQATDDALEGLDRAMRLVLAFFTACVFGYMKKCGVEKEKNERTINGPHR